MIFSPSGRSALWLAGSLSPLALALSMAPPMAQKKGQATKPITGETLFQAKCAPCHGAKGAGGPGYAKALAGNLSLKELDSFIKQSMPPGPKKCPAPDADKIAAYMYDRFYSPLAQERNRPARVELSRLTVRQFKNSVSDLISGFHPATPNSATHGLHGEYYKGRNRDAKDRVIDRVDPTVQFDFGPNAPADKGFDPKNFSIQWTGSVLAPDTGEYEFSIHSKYSCSLWVNGSPKPVVDGEVRSAGDPDPVGTVTLLGGRSYSMTLTFTKATQGVDLAGKKDPKLGDSGVSLLWRRPSHVQEAIPTQFLYPDWSGQSFVPTTPFPPDDRSAGYERGNSVSKDWDEADISAALEAAGYVSKNLESVTSVPPDAKDREVRLRTYCQSFLERAFRHPVSDEIKKAYIDKQFVAGRSMEESVKRVVFRTLISPYFLYREVGYRDHDPYLVASQLSFGLWDTIPDPELEQAAAKGQLATRDQIAAQATRMSNDNRTWNKLRGFLLLWLRVDEAPDIIKNAKSFPTFDAATVSDLRTSLELFLQDTAWGKNSDYRDLMQSKEEVLNGRLSKIYGGNLPPDAPFQGVSLDQDGRAGVITHPYLLSRLGYLDGSDPIHRGVLLERNLLGRTLNPPPQNFAPLAAATHPNLTTRERVSLQTKPEFCNACHGKINPLGFTLERFDAIGKLRDTDMGKPIDSSGSYRSKSGALVKFSGAKELAQYLASSDDAQSAFVEKLFLNVAKQPPLAYGPKTLTDLQHSFSENGYSIRTLLVDMVTATALPRPKP